MARKIFTDESLATFVDETKSYVNKQLLEKADKDHFHKIEEVENLQTALDGKADEEHTHDLSAYETKEEAQIKYDEIKNIKSDWNQNDETAADYIKNRTHYEFTSMVRGEELFLENDISLYDGEYFALDSYALNVGQYVEVVWNDVSYMCEIRQNDSGNACFGDSNLTEYPFYYTEEGTFDTRLYAHAGNHTVTVYYCTVSEVIKKIDKKFLPDDLGGNVDVESLDLISVDDIDTICGSSIEYVNMSEGAF